MTLEELFTSKDSPLTEEQKNELSTEYLFEISEKNDKIRNLEREKQTLSAKTERIKENADEVIRKAVGCITSVYAMLQYSKGSGNTHRMRNFYTEAMMSYIQNCIAMLKRENISDELPF